MDYTATWVSNKSDTVRLSFDLVADDSVDAWFKAIKDYRSSIYLGKDHMSLEISWDSPTVEEINDLEDDIDEAYDDFCDTKPYDLVSNKDVYRAGFLDGIASNG